MVMCLKYRALNHDQESFSLSVANKPFKLSVVMLNAVVLKVMATFIRPNTLYHFVSPGASSGIQTPDLRIIRRMFYHCAQPIDI
jgi:hypothetical protein